jgi:hypothetical protein
MTLLGQLTKRLSSTGNLLWRGATSRRRRRRLTGRVAGNNERCDVRCVWVLGCAPPACRNACSVADVRLHGGRRWARSALLHARKRVVHFASHAKMDRAVQLDAHGVAGGASTRLLLPPLPPLAWPWSHFVVVRNSFHQMSKLSSVKPSLSKAGLHANLIMGGGPHTRTCTEQART